MSNIYKWGVVLVKRDNFFLMAVIFQSLLFSWGQTGNFYLCCEMLNSMECPVTRWGWGQRT